MPSSSRLLPASASRVCAALVCATLACASPAGAHHSFTAVYEMNRVIEITGRITSIRWVNPHIQIYVADDKGQKWEVEAGPVNLLSTRMEIPKSLFNVGETIRVRGNPGRKNARALWVSNILLESGTEVLAAPRVQPHPEWAAKQHVGKTEVLSEKVGETVRADIFGTWKTAIETFPKPRGEPVLTEAGRSAQARYQNGDVIAKCEVPGMPFAMMSPYLIDIAKPQGNQLVIRGEAYDLQRIVYLAAPGNPPDPSPLGMSVGRIVDNKELIIETSRIKYHSYGDFGPAQSDQSHVVERFKLSADGLTLDYDIAVTDPVMLSGPWSWGGSFFATKEKLGRWDCDADGIPTTLIASGVLLGVLVLSAWRFRRWKGRAQRASPSL